MRVKKEIIKEYLDEEKLLLEKEKHTELQRYCFNLKFANLVENFIPCEKCQRRIDKIVKDAIEEKYIKGDFNENGFIKETIELDNYEKISEKKISEKEAEDFLKKNKYGIRLIEERVLEE